MIKLEKFGKKHINAVLKIEEQCFSMPWSKASLEKEIKNDIAIYVVATEGDKVVGYGGMWHIVNEGHITNIAVDKNYRSRGIATMILNRLFEIGRQNQMIGITLEVRMSNNAAKNLYKKLGFVIEGIRREYYEDNGEDAVIMWKYFIDTNLIENF